MEKLCLIYKTRKQMEVNNLNQFNNGIEVANYFKTLHETNEELKKRNPIKVGQLVVYKNRPLKVLSTIITDRDYLYTMVGLDGKNVFIYLNEIIREQNKTLCQ